MVLTYGDYLKEAKRKAKVKGYDPNLLTLSNEPNKKLNYDGVDFGNSNYNDYIIYNYLAKNGDMTQDEANEHRNRYLSRATNIKGEWRDNKISPNNLAINILW